MTTHVDDSSIASDTKPTNPKDIVGSSKLPLHLWPATASALGCLAILDGLLKYGRNNFREMGVKPSIYIDACKRHLDAWFEGEDNDQTSGVPHLGHALACIAIIVDAIAHDKLNDDRNYSPKCGLFRRWLDSLTPHVVRLKQLHSGDKPKHWTIRDNLQ